MWAVECDCNDDVDGGGGDDTHGLDRVLSAVWDTWTHSTDQRDSVNPERQCRCFVPHVRVNFHNACHGTPAFSQTMRILKGVISGLTFTRDGVWAGVLIPRVENGDSVLKCWSDFHTSEQCSRYDYTSPFSSIWASMMLSKLAKSANSGGINWSLLLTFTGVEF